MGNDGVTSPSSSAGTGAFRLVSTALIYDGAVFRLADETFEAPSGELFRRQIVRHGGAVAVVPLHDTATYSTLVTLVNFDATVTTTTKAIDYYDDQLAEFKTQLMSRSGDAASVRKDTREQPAV